jgi:Protein adenylyltransferase SoFic-like, C-terminal domain
MDTFPQRVHTLDMTASVHLKRLVELGLLEEQKHGREKLFVNPDFLRLLTQPDAPS